MSHSKLTHYLTQTALMIALLIVLGFLPGIPLGVIPVPIVLQNMGIMIAAALLGPRYGTAAIALFLFLAFLGLPFLSGGRGGAAIFVGPTAGYMFGWLLVPVVYWALMKLAGNHATNGWLEFAIMIVAGVLLVDGIGSVWLSMQSPMPLAGSLTSNLVFIPGDILKAALTIIIVRVLRKRIAFAGNGQ
ncbi:biotin transporter BioY [Lacticaseibacillus pabuli]|uniref:Biotin transporter n=1 Tax=Lacticaseibacillus pabuli TaxID=3025672 RepID=A0ABY7WTJ2_9LACO|nr:biotin transporter BioY [Lacticaseibacillus sp. KACC 23028]WDF83472.1 biotin transporter BioY [Lacticaseibacillus sp. KACC 23028]